MGYQLFTGADALGVNANVTAPIPSGLKTGDILVAFCFFEQNSTSANAISAPAGWSSLGSQVNLKSVATNLDGRFADFYKTYTLGDPTTYTFSQSPGSTYRYAVIFAIRTDGTLALGTCADHAEAATAATPAKTAAFSPVAVTDLRVAVFIGSFGTAGGVPPTSSPGPTVTPNADNPAGVKFQVLNGTGGSQPSGMGIDSWYSLWSDPGGTDGGVVSWGNVGGTSGTWSRAYCWNDGTSLNGYSKTNEVSLGQSDPGITVDSLQGNESDALDAAKGRYVGGARLL